MMTDLKLLFGHAWRKDKNDVEVYTGFNYNVTGITPPHFCACLKLLPGFPMYIVVPPFCAQCIKVRGDSSFVDIGGVIDCLNFLFLITLH